ncbi:MAG: hypothetical protein SGCHY_001496 [Lobulomycetales sp.]
MEEDEEVVRLWRVYKTVHEMVNDRGYVVSNRELEMDLDEFKDTYARNGTIERHNLTFLVQHSQEETNQLLVFFTEEESVGIKPIKKICERMVTQSIMKGILVYQKNLTPSASKDPQLPRIQPMDPIAKYYGLKRGDVVRIVRPSETAGKYCTYRICW